MYESYYRLQRDPFRLRPDAQFAYRHESYSRARNFLEYGLFRGEGVLLITGAPGSGKSTLVEDLLAQHADIQVARVVGTQTDVDGFLRLVAFALGVTPGVDRTTSLIEIQRCLTERARAGRRVLLIVDNAQDLSRESVEELRVLGSGDADWELQVLLLSNNDLNKLVSGVHMEDLRQRIVACCDLDALTPETTREYILHRLDVAGSSGVPEISAAAFALIHRFTGGNPRRINMLCARLLLKGFAEDRRSFGAADVRSLVDQLSPTLLWTEDTDQLPGRGSEVAPGPPPPPPPPRAQAAVASSDIAELPISLGSTDGILDDEAEQSHWTPPAVPLTFTVEADLNTHTRHRSHQQRSPRYAAEPPLHARPPPATGSRSVWLLLALVLGCALAWMVTNSGVDRGGSGWQQIQDTITDYVERGLDR